MSDDFIRHCEVCKVRVGKIWNGRFVAGSNFAGHDTPGRGYRCKDHAETGASLIRTEQLRSHGLVFYGRAKWTERTIHLAKSRTRRSLCGLCGFEGEWLIAQVSATEGQICRKCMQTYRSEYAVEVKA